MLGQASDLLLRRLQAVDPLPEQDRAALRHLPVPLRQHDARHMLCEVGEPSGPVLLVDGFAARFRALEDGARQITALLVPGDLGDPLGGPRARRDQGLIALTPVLVGTPDGGALREVARRHPAILEALARLVVAENARLAEWMVNIGQRSTDRRIAHLLCEFMVRLRAVGLVAGSSFVLPLSQIDIADMAGISAVHANRVIQQLRAEGLIGLDRRLVSVPDPEALAAFAGFDPGYLETGG